MLSCAKAKIDIDKNDNATVSDFIADSNAVPCAIAQLGRRVLIDRYGRESISGSRRAFKTCDGIS